MPLDPNTKPYLKSWCNLNHDKSITIYILDNLKDGVIVARAIMLEHLRKVMIEEQGLAS